MGCNEWRSGTSISHPFARPSARRGAPTAPPPCSAARSCRWRGKRRSSCSPAPSARGGRAGEIRTVSASFRASPGFPLRFREGYCSCAMGTNCVHVAALVLAATDETLLPATTVAGHRGPPVRAALGAVARLAARHPAGPRRAAAADGTANAPLAVELSLVRNTPEPFRYPSYSTDNGRHEPPAEDATRKLKLQARLVQPGRLGGWVAGNLSWSRLDYLLLRDEFPRRARPPAARAVRPLPGQLVGPALRLLLVRLPRLRRPEVPGPVRLRVPPAVAGPRAGARGRPALRLPGQAGHRAAAGHARSCAWTSPPKAPRCSSPR